MRERARYGPVEVQNGIAKKQLLSTLKIICKYVYDDIFAAISLKQAFWRARHLKRNNNKPTFPLLLRTLSFYNQVDSLIGPVGHRLRSPE